MKARVNKKSVSISEIYNEGQKEVVMEIAEIAKSEIEFSDHSTKAKITTNLSRFITAWNEY